MVHGEEVEDVEEFELWFDNEAGRSIAIRNRPWMTRGAFQNMEGLGSQRNRNKIQDMPIQAYVQSCYMAVKQ